MARIKEYDETEVLHRAMELFWEQGYEKTTMQDLVIHMGIHRRSLYDTFGDKHTLFMRALDHYEELIGLKMDSQEKPMASVKQAIRRLFEIAIYRNDNKAIGCLTVNTAVELSWHDEKVAEKVVNSFSKTEKLLNELILRGQSSGEIPQDYDAAKLSQFMHNSLVGLRVLVKTNTDKEKMESVIDMTLSVMD